LCFSEMVKPGPTVPIRRGVDIGAAGEVARSATAPAAMSVQIVFMGGTTPARALPVCYVTVKLPFIVVKCGSHTNVYLPLTNLTMTVLVPT